MKGQAGRLILWSIILDWHGRGMRRRSSDKPTESLPSPSTSVPAPPATNTPLPPATNTPVPPATNTLVPSAINTLRTVRYQHTAAACHQHTPTTSDRPALNIQFIGAADLSDESKSSLADLIESIQAGVVQITTSQRQRVGLHHHFGWAGHNQRARRLRARPASASG